MSLLKPLANIPSVLSFSIMCLACSPIFAATQIDLSKNALPLSSVTPSITATLGSASSPINIISQHTDSKQVTHVRIKQMYENYPVWGADAVVHLPKTSSFTLKSNADFISALRNNLSIPKNGFFYTDLNKDIANAAPSKFDNDTAKRNALASLKRTLDEFYKDRRYAYSDEEAKVMIYVDDANKAHTAFLVSLFATANGFLPKRPTAIIDAQNYLIYQQWNDIKSIKLSPARATGYGGNPIVGKFEYGKEKKSLAIGRDDANKLCYIKNDDVEVLRKTDLQPFVPGKTVTFNCTKPGTAKSTYQEPEGGYLGQFNGAYSPINDALHQGMVIKKLYKEWYGIMALTKRDHVTPLLLSMNLIYLPRSEDGDDAFENAFWESRTQKMYFGMGGDELYPLVTLDVAAHEISHGFTDQHSSLIYMDQSGALNESFSDMAAVAASYYDSNEKSSDWMIGGGIMKENTGKNKDEYVALRFINDPVKDGSSIDHVMKYPALAKRCKAESARDPDRYQSCIVHLASGVFNKVFYELATAPGWNPRKAFGVMIKANQDYWIPGSSYTSAACGVKEAAVDLYSPEVVATLEPIFKDVGISLNSCA